MSDLYSEFLVKKESTAKDAIVKYGLIVLTVLAAGAGLFINPLLLVLAIALGVACYFVIPRTDLEYEYLFVNGEFDIDMVMAKSKRKKSDVCESVRSRSDRSAEFPQNGLLQWKQPHENTGLFFRKSGAQTFCNHHESRWREQPDHH